MSVPTEKLLENLPALSNMVRRIVVDAGEIIMKYYEMHDQSHVEEKSDGSPVSIADREAEMFIQMSLEMVTPEIPMVGEEGMSQGKCADVTQEEYFWLVDPLDGTKEFINGQEDFTVNVALIKNGQPILGIVYLPATGVLYAGHGPDTAIRWSDEKPNDDKEISVRTPPEEGLTVVSSRHHGNNEALEEFLSGFKVKKQIARGSSVKICAIAEGKADVYPRLGPTCEWDTAAAQAVIEAAGGCLTDMDGKPLTYGHGGKMLNPYFCAASVNWLQSIGTAHEDTQDEYA